MSETTILMAHCSPIKNVVGEVLYNGVPAGKFSERKAPAFTA